MVAVDTGGLQGAAEIGGYGRIGIALQAGHHLNAHQIQGSLHSVTQAAAEHGDNFIVPEEIRQGLMAGAVGGQHPGRNHLTVLNVIDLELLRLPKVLEDISVFVSYCKFHAVSPFFVFCHHTTAARFRQSKTHPGSGTGLAQRPATYCAGLGHTIPQEQKRNGEIQNFFFHFPRNWSKIIL